MACFFYTVAPVRYYPLQGRFYLEAQPEAAGPPILWYGWLLTAAAASAVLSVLVPPGSSSASGMAGSGSCRR